MLSESLVKVKKKAKVLELRKGKGELLKREYENFNAAFTGTSLFHSATRQQAEGFLEGKLKPNKEYPTIPRRDVYS
jgi:cyclopropane fatty-acyl-phospholipid synthase-like methyltransferase